MNVLCKKCEGKLFSKNLIDEHGHFAIDPNDALPLRREGSKSFFICPHCNAKNIIVDAPPIQGVPQMRISNAEE